MKDIFNDDYKEQTMSKNTGNNTASNARSVEDVVIGSVFLLLSIAFLGLSIAMGIGMSLDGAFYLLPVPAIFLMLSIIFVAVTALDLITGDARQFVRNLHARVRAAQASKEC